MKTEATQSSDEAHQSANAASVSRAKGGSASVVADAGSAWATLQRYKRQANSSPRSTTLVQRGATMATSAAAASLRATQSRMDALQVPKRLDSPAAAESVLQRRVINMGGENDEVLRSAGILASDYALQSVNWPIDALDAEEVEIFVDHSTGDKLGGKTPDEFAEELAPRTQAAHSYTIHIAACNTGKKLNNEGDSFASLLAASLKSKHRNATVTAPKLGLYIGGPKMYVQSERVPFAEDTFRQSIEPALIALSGVYMGRLIENCCNAIDTIEDNDPEKERVADVINGTKKHRLTKDELTGGQRRKTAAIKRVLALCLTPTKNGRQHIEAALDALNVSLNVASEGDWLKAQRAEKFQIAYEALVAADPRYLVDREFGGNAELWTKA